MELAKPHVGGLPPSVLLVDLRLGFPNERPRLKELEQHQARIPGAPVPAVTPLLVHELLHPESVEGLICGARPHMRLKAFDRSLVESVHEVVGVNNPPQLLVQHGPGVPHNCTRPKLLPHVLVQQHVVQSAVHLVNVSFPEFLVCDSGWEGDKAASSLAPCGVDLALVQYHGAGVSHVQSSQELRDGFLHQVDRAVRACEDWLARTRAVVPGAVMGAVVPALPGLTHARALFLVGVQRGCRQGRGRSGVLRHMMDQAHRPHSEDHEVLEGVELSFVVAGVVVVVVVVLRRPEVCAKHVHLAAHLQRGDGGVEHGGLSRGVTEVSLQGLLDSGAHAPGC
mmetsp:Transcript_17713/g.24481  ORF Transcript_17713/g.24481 Transcript_17713/m.24481 type:complete len:338 (-) Transcript_17713:66-1079(-)